MNNFVKVLWASLSLLPVSCAARAPSAGQINFDVVENQGLFLSDDQMHQKAQDYLAAALPAGYPLQKAIAILIEAGATCSYQIDPQDPTYYVCDYNRPGRGLARPFIEIDWIICLHFDIGRHSLVRITVDRYETGP